jgi:hypothetical protein
MQENLINFIFQKVWGLMCHYVGYFIWSKSNWAQNEVFKINMLEGNFFNTYVKPYGLTYWTLFPLSFGGIFENLWPYTQRFFLGEIFCNLVNFSQILTWKIQFWPMQRIFLGKKIQICQILKEKEFQIAKFLW